MLRYTIKIQTEIPRFIIRHSLVMCVLKEFVKHVYIISIFWFSGARWTSFLSHQYHETSAELCMYALVVYIYRLSFRLLLTVCLRDFTPASLQSSEDNTTSISSLHSSSFDSEDSSDADTNNVERALGGMYSSLVSILKQYLLRGATV